MPNIAAHWKVHFAKKVQEKPKRPGFAVLMKGFPGTDPYQCILCKGRLRFAGAMAGEHATKMLSDRLHRMAKKRWHSDPGSG
ncbi:hypothetical protein RX799_24450 [Klebsiella oxytoca]|uniref:hypothetical protein n=1 Tax=Klebsiella oxytoca TaxID=571 RepID=UPI00384DF4EA